MIKAIIFDIGDTLTRNRWEKRLEAVKRETGVSMLNVIQLRGDRNDIVIGKKSFEKQIQRYIAEKEPKKNAAKVIKNYEKNYEKYAPINKKVARLIIKLRKQYKLYAFSNTNDLHARVNRKRGAYKYFHKTFLSNEIELRKPDKKAFVHVLRRIRLPAQSCVFIDDNKENIDAASLLGMKAVFYKSYKKLITDLKKLGVKGI